MTSFLLFSIIPSLLLLPFVYVCLKKLIEEANHAAENDCIESQSYASAYSFYNVAMNDLCHLTESEFMSRYCYDFT